MLPTSTLIVLLALVTGLYATALRAGEAAPQPDAELVVAGLGGAVDDEQLGEKVLAAARELELPGGAFGESGTVALLLKLDKPLQPDAEGRPVAKWLAGPLSLAAQFPPSHLSVTIQAAGCQGRLDSKHFKPGVWYQLVFVYDRQGGNHDIYLNGRAQGCVSKVEEFKPEDEARPVTFGGGLRLGPLSFWQRKLKPEEIAALAAQRKVPGYGDVGLQTFGEPIDLDAVRGDSIAAYDFSAPKQLEDWVLEGPGKLEVKDGKLHWETSEGHTVWWLKKDAPKEFLFEWELTPVADEGLCIVFCCAKGKQGEDILTGGLAPRNGVFNLYHSGDFNCYHFSYWCASRGSCNLRKNAGFFLAAIAEHPKPDPLPNWAGSPHMFALLRQGDALTLVCDGKIIMRYADEKGENGPPLGEGKVGLRMMSQMQSAQYDEIRLSKLK
ncbi:MAG: DUF1961 family protein [Planctomycetota bacterium]|nr:DUF1961 family protein [Planctomycetota bacterium]